MGVGGGMGASGRSEEGRGGGGGGVGASGRGGEWLFEAHAACRRTLFFPPNPNLRKESNTLEEKDLLQQLPCGVQNADFLQGPGRGRKGLAVSPLHMTLLAFGMLSPGLAVGGAALSEWIGDGFGLPVARSLLSALVSS